MIGVYYTIYILAVVLFCAWLSYKLDDHIYPTIVMLLLWSFPYLLYC